MAENTLAKIQQGLKAPKNLYNNFGKYSYRSCESILEAVKPLLGDAVLTLDDEIVHIGDRYYVKATACLVSREGKYMVSAYAREEETKKGMDAAQISGAASSYSRKYALQGLLLLDDSDSKDPDHTQGAPNPTPEEKIAVEPPVQTKEAPTGQSEKVKKALKWTLKQGMPEDEIKKAIGPLNDVTEEDLPGLKAAYMAWKNSQIEFIKCPDGQERPISYCGDCVVPELKCDRR